MDMTVIPEFKRSSNAVVKDFLQSVVAIDDSMSFESRNTSEQKEELVVPDDEGFDVALTDEKQSKDYSSADHNFYYQEFSSELSKFGIVCGALKPLEDFDATLAAVLKTSENADVTVLDWQMDANRESGTLARESIVNLYENDLSEGGRLRLIIVYTAEETSEVKRLIKERMDAQSIVSSEGHDHISASINGISNWRVKVVSKSISEEHLVEKIIESFSELTSGILSNAAMSAILDVRNNTHNLLDKFNPSLDVAYLTHVLSLILQRDTREKAREVALDYAIELISEELKSQLQVSALVKEKFSKENLSSWPCHVNPSSKEDHFKFKLHGKKKEDVKEVVLKNEEFSKFLSVGGEKQFSELLKKHNISKSFLANLRKAELSAGKPSEEAYMELSSIECVRRSSKVGDYSPVLKRGVILKNPFNKKFYVCIQPLCDSVRVRSDQSFMMLEVDLVTGNGAFTHVVKKNSEFFKFNINPKAKNIYNCVFSPGDGGVVLSEVKNGKDIFLGHLEWNSLKIPFEWVAELKQPVSQAISNNVASVLSRVGSDSFEWLRVIS